MEAIIIGQCSEIYFTEKDYTDKAGRLRHYEGYNIEIYNPNFKAQYDRYLTLVMSAEDGRKNNLDKPPKLAELKGKNCRIDCDISQYQNQVRLTPKKIEVVK